MLWWLLHFVWRRRRVVLPVPTFLWGILRYEPPPPGQEQSTMFLWFSRFICRPSVNNAVPMVIWAVTDPEVPPSPPPPRAVAERGREDPGSEPAAETLARFRVAVRRELGREADR